MPKDRIQRIKTMKKLLYILSLIWVAVSCNDELVDTKPVVDSDKVTIDFSVSIPEAPVQTKAFADKPALTNLYLAVFDENGFLVEYVKADPANTDYATSNGTLYKYSVALTLSETKRIIHFIANAPETLRYGTEEEIITALYTEGTNDAYWYRKEVSNIQAQDLSASPLVPSAATIAALSNIPLIRNFAKIEVSTAAGCAFTLQSYAVINAPNKGAVAAYNRKDGTFVDYPGKTVTQLRTAGYDAYVPGDATLNSDISNLHLDEITSPSPLYIYERETPTSNPVYILVYGQYGGKNVYYRVDLRDDEGKYFPLLRNFQYTVNINQVSHTGYANPEDAVNSAGSGDISTSIETEHLTNISDGSVRMSVNYTSKVLVTEENVDLKYNIENLGGVTLNSVVITCEGEALSGIVVDNSTVLTTTNSTPQSNQWVTLEVDPAAIGSEQKKGTITIVATYDTDKTIQRRVTYTLRKPYEMEIACVPKEVPYGVNEEVNLNITIPDDLGSSMFPLDFTIEAAALSLTPNNDNLPVSTGLSTIPDKSGKSAFWYVKSLTKTEYDALQVVDGKRTFQCHFKANTNNSATSIYVTNPYFVAYVDDILPSVTGLQPYDVDRFTNYTQQYFRNLAYNLASIPMGVDMSTKFSFTMTTVPDGLVTVTLTNAKPADGETDLVNPRADSNGNAVFDFDPSTTSGSFDLLTTTESGAVMVKLEANHFETASLAVPRDWMQFANLTISPNRLLQGVGRSASISFSMDADDTGYATRTVRVELDGLENAEGKNILEFKPVTSGNVTVTGTGTNRTVTVSGLYTSTESDPVKFTVSASGYEDKVSALKNRSRGTFGGMTFSQNGTTVTSLSTASQEVDFNFTLSDYDPNMYITVTLDGFETADGTLLTKAGEYIYKPEGPNCSITLKTAKVTNDTECKVTLSEPYFTEEYEKIWQTDKIVIPKGNLVVNFAKNSTHNFAYNGTIGIYTAKTGGTKLAEYDYTRSSNGNGNGASNRRATNSVDIEITGVSKETTVYVRYTTSGTTYSASFTLGDAVDRVVTLNF